ncbi:MFS transporter [Streptomyces sp. NPDC095613]|uniref:MFS transporter n=1 Tax=Streptomyces sp. NPDC095613 TaxID=3155540 RepID=UPI00331EA987
MSVCGSALGPVLGGLPLEHFWWGSVFLINVPVVVLALAAAAVLAPSGSGRSDTPWDLVASVQIMVGPVGLVYAVKEVTKPGPRLPHLVIALAAAAVGFVLFLRRQRRQEHPLLDTALLRDPRIGAGIAAGGLLHRTGPRPLIAGGLLVGAAGVLGTLLLTPGAVPFVRLDPGHPAWIAPGLLVAGAGLGAVMTAASAVIMGNAPAHRAGMAASVEEVSYELGSLSGVAVLGSVLGSLYTATVHLPAGAPAAAEDSLDAARAVAARLSTTEAAALRDAAHRAFDHGYTATLLIAGVALAAGGVFTARHLAPPAPAPEERRERQHVA